MDLDHLQCPNCHSNGLIIHAYYDRHVDIFDRNHTIRILRFKCPSCNSIHAVLIEDMVPYSIVSFDIIVDVLKNNDFLSSSHVSFIKNKYLFFIIDYISFCRLNVRNNYFSFYHMTFIYFSSFPCYSLFVVKKGAVIHMKFSNDSIIDDEIDKNDTINALISNDDLLKFFNLERDNVQKILITHKKDGVYVNITLNQTYCQCPVCGNMTNRVKDYKDKKITHSILTVTSCYIIYHARRYQCIHCKKAFYENNPFTFGG